MFVILLIVLAVLFIPFFIGGFFILNPREEMVILRFGRYGGTFKLEGLHWTNPIGRSLRRIPTRDVTFHIERATVVERNGNPIVISAVVVYRVEDTRKAALDVDDFRRFIEDQAGAVVKRVSARFPYESPDKTQPCLKNENDAVCHAYMAALHHAVQPAGIRVLSVRLNDLTYAPEIAQAMLMRQQAQALIDARKMIVDGAVAIVHDAVEKLRAAGLDLSSNQREALISNLLIVLCSGERAQPVLQVQSSPSSSTGPANSSHAPPE